MDSVSGQLTTRASLLDAPDTVTLTVTATDHGYPLRSTSTVLTVFVAPPLAAPASDPSLRVLTLSVPETAAVDTAVGTVDPYPASQAVSYVIVSGNYDVSFAVVRQADGTGQLQVAGQLDYETYPAFQLLVAADIGGAGAMHQLVKVTVVFYYFIFIVHEGWLGCVV